MNTLIATFESVNQFLTTKFPTLLFVVGFAFFVGYTLTSLNDMSMRVNRIESVDLPTMRDDSKKIQDDVNVLDVRDARFEENMKEYREDVKEIKEDIKELRADLKTIIFVLSEKKKP